MSSLQDGTLEELYRPLIGSPWILAHLGQSLDGKIAARNGQSRYVTGPENLDHLHRLRALADAVVVGAGTVAEDDPQLTVRRCAGDNPLRVVLDPRRRLAAERGVFTDGAAKTLIFALVEGPAPGLAEVEIVRPDRDGGLFLPAVVERLRRRGVRRFFIEGGGVTVSRFLQAGLLDRLQICVAPIIMGEGRPGLALPPVADLSDALRPSCRAFRMGRDVLFDCDLRQSPAE